MPQGFIPTQDKDYLVAFAQLPDAATLDRTEAVIRKMSAIALEQPGVSNAVAFPGLSINGFVNASNSGIAFVILKPAKERAGHPEESAAAIVAGAEREVSPASRKRSSRSSRRRRCRAWARSAASSCMSRTAPASASRSSTHRCRARLARATRKPSLAGLFSSFQVSVPQIDAHVDRERAKTYGVPLTDVFDTLQVYLGSLYVNDFNRFGRTYQVNVQAESGFRLQPEQIRLLQTRNAGGAMVPLGSLVTVTQGYGPDQVMHYNGYPAAEINGGPRPGFSSGQAQAAIAEVLDARLPGSMAFEWTELAYQEIDRRQHDAAASSRCACCSSTSCSRRSTRAGRCRSA